MQVISTSIVNPFFPLGLQDSISNTTPGFDNAKVLQQAFVTPNHSVGQPGTLESLIPVWGAGRAAVDDFQNGRWGWGIFNRVIAISDVFLVKALVTTIGKAVAESLVKRGVYDLTTSGGRYVGQSNNMIMRVFQHFKLGKKPGKLSLHSLEEAISHDMPGSTKLEREACEQYVIDGYDTDNLINIDNPMGRVAENFI